MDIHPTMAYLLKKEEDPAKDLDQIAPRRHLRVIRMLNLNPSRSSRLSHSRSPTRLKLRGQFNRR